MLALNPQEAASRVYWTQLEGPFEVGSAPCVDLDSLASAIQRPPKEVGANIKWRTQVVMEAESNPAFAAALKHCFQSDPIFAIDGFMWTYDPRTEPYDHPFVTYDYQEYLLGVVHHAVTQKHDLQILKCRDMGATWVICAYALWRWLADTPGRAWLLASRKEELVDKSGATDTLFHKLRYNLNRLPRWLIPESFNPTKHSLNMLLHRPDNENTIKGEATNMFLGSGGRYECALMDEFALWQPPLDAASWTAASQSTPCRIALSTFKGSQNKFFDLSTTMKHQVRLWWFLDKRKDEFWFGEQQTRLSPEEFAQEIEMNPYGSLGKRYFKNFDPATHWLECSVVPGRPFLVGWDFGFHHPSMVVCQIDPHDRLLQHRLVMGRDVDIATFAEYCWARLREWFGEGATFHHYGDIAGSHKSDKGTSTSLQILEKVLGASVLAVPVRREQVNEVLRHRLNKLISGKPSYILSRTDDAREELPAFIESEDNSLMARGFLGGIHYAERPYPGQPDDWHKDGYFEHPFDALGFILWNKFRHQANPNPHRQEQTLAIQAHNEETLLLRRNIRGVSHGRIAGRQGGLQIGRGGTQRPLLGG